MLTGQVTADQRVIAGPQQGIGILERINIQAVKPEHRQGIPIKPVHQWMRRVKECAL